MILRLAAILNPEEVSIQNFKMNQSKQNLPRRSVASTILGTHSLALGYVISMITVVIWLEIFVVIPSLFIDPSLYTAVFALFVYGTVNVVGNYYCLLRTDTSYKEASPLNEEKNGFFYCQSCEQNSPPRAHHCSFCGKCIVRRDHHCVFTTSCVGHANIRFFVVFNVFVSVSSGCVVVMNLFYLHYNLGPLLPLNLETICKIIPFLSLFKLWGGSVTLFYFLVIVVTWLCFIQVIGCCGCFFFQMSLIFSGQTTYEWRRDIFIYDRGWRLNFLDVCGSWWFLWWFFPIFQLKQLGSDGETYYSQYISKTSKYV